MITTENKNFLRIILLLYDAASFILRHIITRELEKHGDDLDNLLKKDEFNNKLKHQLHFGKSQIEKLFPSNGKTEIKTWDSQMLAVVSTLIFRSTLSSDEKFYINCIKHARNRIAHKASAYYSEDDFVDEKDAIVKGIIFLASSFDTTVQESCRKLISSYCSDLFDVQLAIKHLEEDTNNGELLRQILDAINQKHEIVRNDIQDHAERIENTIHLTEKKICERQETVLKNLNGLCLDIGNVESKVTESKEKSSQELKQINASLTNHIVNEAEKVSQKVDSNNSLLQEVQRNQNEHAAKLEAKLEEVKQLFEQTSRSGGNCTKQIKFGQHTHLTVDGPTPEWINTVETVLKSVFDLLLNNVQEPGQNPETEKAVEEFLNFIKGFTGVELKAVERKCILLAFECLTYESLKELIEFINSNGFHSYLESIARALEKDLKIPQKLMVSSEIPVSSLQLVVDDKSPSIEPESKKGIALTFECTSIDGLDAFWRLFVKREATPYIDKIATTLTENTLLSTSVNLQEFEDALKRLEATVNKENKTGLVKPDRETTQQSPDSELYIDTREISKDLELSVEENYQDELIKPDPLLSVYTSVQDTKSEDLREHSEISAQSCLLLTPRLHEHEYQCGIELEETLYSSEQQLRISPSDHNNCISLVYQEESHLPYGIDANTTICACAILSHERLMIADFKELSIVNMHAGLFEHKKSLDRWGSDIAVLPKDQVAVTLPLCDKIAILNTHDMSLIRSIPTDKFPCSITYHQDTLYLVCARYSCVNILNLQGDLFRKIECDKLLFCPFTKIAVSMDAQNLYISCYKSLIRYSAQGEVYTKYTFERGYPKALTLLDDGSLVVVSATINGIHTIHHISADLQQGYELTLDTENTRFIGVDPVKNKIYVIYKDRIKVYNMQKQHSQCQSDKKLTPETADEKFSSLKAAKRFLSLEAHKELTSLKAGKKVLSFKTNEQLASIKTGRNLPSLKTDEELTLFKAGTRLSARETDEEIASFKARIRLHSGETDGKSASFKAGTRFHSRETDKE